MLECPNIFIKIPPLGKSKVSGVAQSTVVGSGTNEKEKGEIATV